MPPEASPGTAGAPARRSDGGGAPLIEIEGLEVRFGGKVVLSEVDLRVRPGEIVTLIGPNGAGKSTLARVVLGLQKAGGGTIRRAADVTIGYVPQKLAIDPILPLTVRRFLNLPKRRPEPVLRDGLAEVGAEHLLERPVQALSGGEFRRMLLARALLRDPDLLVLDEPLQGVDFSGQFKLFSLIERVRGRRGCGVLLVSHDLHLVMAGTDHVVCLNNHICCSGRPDAVSAHPEYLRLFGPQAAQGLALYTHEHDHDHDISGEILPMDGRDRSDRDHGDGRRQGPRHG